MLTEQGEQGMNARMRPKWFYYTFGNLAVVTASLLMPLWYPERLPIWGPRSMRSVAAAYPYNCAGGRPRPTACSAPTTSRPAEIGPSTLSAG